MLVMLICSMMAAPSPECVQYTENSFSATSTINSLKHTPLRSEGPAYLVRALHNEVPVALPPCGGQLMDCPLSTVLDFYGAKSGHQTACDFDSVCECSGAEGGEAVCGRGQQGSEGTSWPSSIESILGAGGFISPETLVMALSSAVVSMACAGVMLWAFLRASAS